MYSSVSVPDATKPHTSTWLKWSILCYVYFTSFFDEDVFSVVIQKYLQVITKKIRWRTACVCAKTEEAQLLGPPQVSGPHRKLVTPSLQVRPTGAGPKPAGASHLGVLKHENALLHRKSLIQKQMQRKKPWEPLCVCWPQSLCQKFRGPGPGADAGSPHGFTTSSASHTRL